MSFDFWPLGKCISLLNTTPPPLLLHAPRSRPIKSWKNSSACSLPIGSSGFNTLFRSQACSRITLTASCTNLLPCTSSCVPVRPDHERALPSDQEAPCVNIDQGGLHNISGRKPGWDIASMEGLKKVTWLQQPNFRNKRLLAGYEDQ